MWHVGERMKCERMVSDTACDGQRGWGPRSREPSRTANHCVANTAHHRPGDTFDIERRDVTSHDNPAPMKIFSTPSLNRHQRHYMYSADCPVRKAPRARLRTAPPPQSHTASVSHRLSLTPPPSHTASVSHSAHAAPGRDPAPTRLPRLMRSARGFEELSHTAARP